MMLLTHGDTFSALLIGTGNGTCSVLVVFYYSVLLASVTYRSSVWVLYLLLLWNKLAVLFLVGCYLPYVLFGLGVVRSEILLSERCLRY